MKRVLFAILCLLLAVTTCLPAGAAGYAPDFDPGATAVYLYNLDTDSVMYQKNADQQAYPASVTKIMTCILAMENTADLDSEIVTYPLEIQNWLYDYQWVQGNGAVSLGDLAAGEQLTMRQMLYAIMLPSANEAAMAIAQHIGGSQEGFAEMMNQKARELGCKNTNFVNPNGLYDDNHYTSAYDMFLITKYALELPGFEDIVTTVTYETGPTNMHENLTWSTTIRMQIEENSEYYYPGLRGVKTGTLPKAGYCFVSTCTRDGFTYLLVVLGSPYFDEAGNVDSTNNAFVDTKKLYDWVFSNFRRKLLVEEGSYEADIPLTLSLEQDTLKLSTAERYTDLVPVSTEASSVTKIADIPDSIAAPVSKGDHVGYLRLILGGEEIGRVELVAMEAVEASTILVLWEKAKGVLGSFWFKFGLILIVLLILFYVTLMILRNRNRRRRAGFRPKRRM